MKRLFLVALVGLSLSTAASSQDSKKAKKGKTEKTEKKETVSKEKKAAKKPVEAKEDTKTEVAPSPTPIMASPASENILLFNAEKGKTRGKLVVAMEKSPDFAKTPKLLGRYQVRATQRGEETEKAQKTPTPAAKETKVNKPAPATPTEKPAEKKAESDEGGEN